MRVVSSVMSSTGPAAKRKVSPDGERIVKVRLGNLFRPEICAEGAGAGGASGSHTNMRMIGGDASSRHSGAEEGTMRSGRPGSNL